MAVSSMFAPGSGLAIALITSATPHPRGYPHCSAVDQHVTRGRRSFGPVFTVGSVSSLHGSSSCGDSWRRPAVFFTQPANAHRLLDRMRPERFQAKGETIAQDTGLQCQGGTGRAGPAVHVEAAGGPAPEGVALAVEDDRVLERRGRDVRLAGSAHDAGLGHQKYTVDGQVKAVAAD